MEVTGGQWSDNELQETDSLKANLPAAQNAEEGYIPVKFPVEHHRAVCNCVLTHKSPCVRSESGSREMWEMDSCLTLKEQHEDNGSPCISKGVC